MLINIVEFDKKIFELVDLLGFKLVILGYVYSYPIYLVQIQQNQKYPNILITSGFHGDEPAGCFSILRFINSLSHKSLPQLNITFIPRVNPTGLAVGTRNNIQGEDPNRGYYKNNFYNGPISLEGLMLRENLKLLLLSARDGFLTLHEDIDCFNVFYIYAFASKSIVPNVAKEIFKNSYDFLTNRSLIQGFLHPKENDIRMNVFDTSFEDFLFQNGIPITLCTECPGANKIDMRVDLCLEIIEIFNQEALLKLK